jgi:hypothetical protein
MDIGTISTLLQAVAVSFAVGFGVVQVRQIRAQQQLQAAFALMQSLQTRDMLKALLLLDSLPEGLSQTTIAERLGDDFLVLQSLLGTWESLGILVFRGAVNLDLVDDFYSGSLVHSWRKLQHLVADVRAESGRETRWEWFQWLAERMLEREAHQTPVPAHVAHRHWLPS